MSVEQDLQAGQGSALQPQLCLPMLGVCTARVAWYVGVTTHTVG